jgi:5'-nucleotidase/UDP-sugar diphosphatase
LRWDLDMSKPKGQRFSNVQVRNKTTGAWTALDPAKTYVLVTNDFVAAGATATPRWARSTPPAGT